ncbi:hypothetical protein PPL_00508 [Heterostelium album PN500]|uniref:Double-strand-break repair protein rad21 n=1 Tax=Heterostelium pallidum (strain ATCC 26659 / Pp 5 / PN500) TaxID=670386 RepID=D3AWN2_HETP5|nr:hypothetical protein PPL_00508 [Heterostelium album PN500]EFA86705.1 hypothetical protein PPL_00508 [Heterostelium album PN500]|eukprot:XP_020438809.1 hypothetical protein PPL_00508 [Heterostelium album PN500]
MFFSQIVLAKRGPLAKIWLAGHWDKKLTKKNIFKTNIPKSIRYIINPHLPMALRMTSHLLLGVVRIFSKKVKFLLDDCGDAVARFKGTTKIATPGITLTVAEEEEDPQTLAATSKPINIAQQIDDYLRGVDRIEDLVIDRFFESKNFQQLYIDTMKSAAAPYTPAGKGKQQQQSSTVSGDQPPTTPGQDLIQSEDESGTPSHLDVLKQQRLDRDIEDELNRMEARRQEDVDDEMVLPGQPPKGQEDSFIGYKEWMENYHADEMIIRGAQRPSIQITPQRPSLPGGSEEQKKKFGTELSIDEEFPPPSPESPYRAPKEMSGYDQELLIQLPTTEITGEFDPNQFYQAEEVDKLLEPANEFVEFDKDMFPTADEPDVNAGMEIETHAGMEFDYGGGEMPDTEPQPQEDITKAALSEEEKQHTTDSEANTQRKVLPVIPLVGPSEKEKEKEKKEKKKTPSVRRYRHNVFSEAEINKLKNHANLLLAPHTSLPTSNNEFKVATNTSVMPGPKYSLLLPIRRKMNLKIVNYFRDIFQHKYTDVLSAEDINQLNYIKANKIHHSLKEYAGQGVEFDSRMKEGLGIPADADFENVSLKEQIIQKNVTSHIEDSRHITPNKRRKFDLDITVEEEESLLADLEKELDQLAMKPALPSVGEEIQDYKQQPGSPIGGETHGIDTHDMFNYDDYQGGGDYPQDDDLANAGLSPIPHQQQEADDSLYKTPQSTKKTPGPGTWTPRTATMHNVLNSYFSTSKSTTIQFNSLVSDKQTRVAVAGTFYELLVLKTKGLVQVQQDESYGDILITKTEQFHQTKTWAKTVEGSLE